MLRKQKIKVGITLAVALFAAIEVCTAGGIIRRFIHCRVAPIVNPCRVTYTTSYPVNSNCVSNVSYSQPVYTAPTYSAPVYESVSYGAPHCHDCNVTACDGMCGSYSDQCGGGGVVVNECSGVVDYGYSDCCGSSASSGYVDSNYADEGYVVESYPTESYATESYPSASYVEQSYGGEVIQQGVVNEGVVNEGVVSEGYVEQGSFSNDYYGGGVVSEGTIVNDGIVVDGTVVGEQVYGSETIVDGGSAPVESGGYTVVEPSAVGSTPVEADANAATVDHTEPIAPVDTAPMEPDFATELPAEPAPSDFGTASGRLGANAEHTK